MNWMCHQRHWLRIMMFWGGVLLLGAHNAAAANTPADDISNIPMETRQNTPPPNIMFIIDNSSSMNYEAATDEEMGFFWHYYPLSQAYDPNHTNQCPDIYTVVGTDYARHPPFAAGNGSLYCRAQFFDGDPFGDLTAVPGSSSSSYDVIYYGQYDPTIDRLWRYRWSGANRMYYDPSQQYHKWPDFIEITPPSQLLPWVPVDPRTPNKKINLSNTYNYYGSDNYYNKPPYDAYYNNPPLSTKKPPSSPSFSFIPNSHYFVWHDANNNGKVDDKEVWLVTLSYAGGSVTRSYYNFQLKSGNMTSRQLPADPGVPADMQRVKIGDNELVAVPAASVPADVRPHWAQADGTQYEPTPQEELLNFAAWFTYYRSRSLAAIGAISEAIGRLSGVKVGLYTINPSDSSLVLPRIGARTGVYPVRVTQPDGSIADATTTLRNMWLYKLQMPQGPGGTPLKTAYQNVGKFFDLGVSDGFKPCSGSQNQADYCLPSTDPSYSYYPWACSEAGGTCQQSFAIMVTDGEWNDNPDVQIGNYDGKFPPPYQDGVANTLADLVMSYWDKDLATNLADNVPTSIKDNNNRQHLVTYTIGFGVNGTIPLNDMNKNGISDDIEQPGCSYADNPNFIKPDCAIMPKWPTDLNVTNAKIDDLWHAAVNGHGQYFSAAKPQDLANALLSITTDINSRRAIGASAAVSSGQLNDKTAVYVGRYNPKEWTGDLFAYKFKIDLNGKITGEVDVDNPLWSAAKELASNTNRVIFTSNGDGHSLEFTSTGLADSYFSAAQRQMLTIPGNLTFADSIAYLRGKGDITGVRKRGGPTAGDNVLGDIIHSAAVLVRATANSGSGTIFVGANDGMLHAFDIQTGAERFAFIPSLVHNHLVDLGKLDYPDNHRYYLDASPVVEHLAFFNNSDGLRTKDMNLLVSGLGRGGKGYFALDVSNADTVKNLTDTASMLKWEYPSRSMSVTGLDTNGDGRVESNTPVVGNPSAYTYQYEASDNDGRDNDGNTKALYIYDGSGAKVGRAYRDDDLGYSYSTPVIVRSYLSTNKAMPTGDNDHPWVVIFGNGYNSYNGKAILYVLDALTGQLIRKIDTGVGGEPDRPKNGLSSPAVVDVDDDDRADFAYAGDLRGNLWKFDLRANDPSKWCVFHENSVGQPQPLFTTASAPSAMGQPITTMPQVAYHSKNSGYMVVFGTGKLFNEIDRTDSSVQSLFGVWDNDSSSQETPPDRQKYLGIWNRTTNKFSNQSTGNLLKQEVLLQQTIPIKNPDTGDSNNVTIRITSNNSSTASGWWSADNPSGYMGWYLDLPGRGNIDVINGGTAKSGTPNTDAAERVVKDPLIRDGKMIAVSFIPSGTPCGAGGYSFLMELSAFTGDRPKTAQLDINGDGKLTIDDLIAWAGGQYPPSGIGMDGMINPPAFTGAPGESGERGETEMKILPGSSGVIKTVIEQAPEVGIHYWREMTTD